MRIESLSSLVSRMLFLLAFALLAGACIEWLANVVGYTMLGDVYRPGRLLEFAAVFVIFVIALLLRQVREELRKQRGAA